MNNFLLDWSKISRNMYKPVPTRLLLDPKKKYYLAHDFYYCFKNT